METHSSILAWKIPQTKKPDGLQSVESQRARHDSTTEDACMHICNVQNRQIHTKQWLPWDFPGGLVAKTPRSQCRRPGFNLRSGNQIPYATTKTRCSQINKYFNNSNHNQVEVARDLGERGLRVTARGYRVSLGCSSQAYKVCTCPASRLKKDPRVSNRNASGLRMRELTCDLT